MKVGSCHRVTTRCIYKLRVKFIKAPSNDILKFARSYWLQVIKVGVCLDRNKSWLWQTVWRENDLVSNFTTFNSTTFC